MKQIKIKANNKKGYYDFNVGGVIDISYPSSMERRGRVQGNGEICPSLCCEMVLVRLEWRDECIESEN